MQAQRVLRVDLEPLALGALLTATFLVACTPVQLRALRKGAVQCLVPTLAPVPWAVRVPSSFRGLSFLPTKALLTLHLLAAASAFLGLVIGLGQEGPLLPPSVLAQ